MYVQGRQLYLELLCYIIMACVYGSSMGTSFRRSSVLLRLTEPTPISTAFFTLLSRSVMLNRHKHITLTCIYCRVFYRVKSKTCIYCRVFYKVKSRSAHMKSHSVLAKKARDGVPHKPLNPAKHPS